ncbi:MAG: lipopolysaccharide heptosyltransferase I [Zoogloeaceae bacterium]|jgi:heptosyltransferase-1|nr:lipopolysaccharide heptosyltransferase I [Zoogloeaceae bacterium]
MPSSPANPAQILLVKTSSMGDVIHNLPVVSDLRARFPEAHIDWVVEEAFADIPRLHPGVRQVLPVALRRWKKHLLFPATWREIGAARRAIAATDYDVVLDTQGLVKSALITRQARGLRLGYEAASAREPLAARAYDAVFSVPKTLHAVARNRQLAAAALAYAPTSAVDYGLMSAHSENSRSAVFLTATSRDDKLWPEANWINLGRALAARGLSLLLPGGNSDERARAARIARHIPDAQAIPSMRLADLATLIAHARFAVGVDTGLAHLAAAVKTPILALYTATDPGLTGVLGVDWFKNLGGKGKPPTMQEALTALVPLLPASA